MRLDAGGRFTPSHLHKYRYQQTSVDAPKSMVRKGSSVQSREEAPRPGRCPPRTRQKDRSPRRERPAPGEVRLRGGENGPLGNSVPENVRRVDSRSVPPVVFVQIDKPSPHAPGEHGNLVTTVAVEVRRHRKGA